MIQTRAVVAGLQLWEEAKEDGREDIQVGVEMGMVNTEQGNNCMGIEVEMSNMNGDETWDRASQQSSPTCSHQLQVREKVVVKGKRRIWGTLRAASATALKKNICQLTGIVEEKCKSSVSIRS